MNFETLLKLLTESFFSYHSAEFVISKDFCKHLTVNTINLIISLIFYLKLRVAKLFSGSIAFPNELNYYVCNYSETKFRNDSKFEHPLLNVLLTV